MPPLDNATLSVAEAVAKGLAALAVGLFYFMIVILPWARSHRA